MDYNILHDNIKRLCMERGINLSCLEKNLRFSTGAISRWGQSSPSIDKVMAVAKYFDISLDILCGMESGDTDSEFIQCMIQRTSDDRLYWSPCSEEDFFEKKFAPRISLDEIQECYISQYEEGKFYLISNEMSEFELYIMIENGMGFRQNESKEVLKILWEAVEEQVGREREKIKHFIEKFMEAN